MKIPTKPIPLKIEKEDPFPKSEIYRKHHSKYETEFIYDEKALLFDVDISFVVTREINGWGIWWE